MKQTNTLKHFEAIAKKASNARPELQKVHHFNDRIEATDGYRYLVKLNEPAVTVESDERYPDTTSFVRLVKHEDTGFEKNAVSVTVNADYLLDMASALKAMNGKQGHKNITITIDPTRPHSPVVFTVKDNKDIGGLIMPIV